MLAPHKWNKLLVLLINMFEIVLITLSLSLTVYQDDASSVLFLFMMLYTLLNSMKNRGTEVGKQYKITITIVGLLFLMGIIKTIVYFKLNKAISKEEFEGSYQVLLNTLGMQINPDYYDDPISGNHMIVISAWKSFDFEFLALIFNILLLVFYSGQAKAREQNSSYGYINHSLFLQQYWLFQYVFFAALLMDTAFVQSFIQLAVLILLFAFFYKWTLKSTKQSELDNMLGFITKAMKFLVYLQLAALSLFQVAFIRILFVNLPRVTEIMQAIGLETNYGARYYQKAAHTLLLCLILVSGQVFQNLKESHEELQKKIEKQKEENAKLGINEASGKKAEASSKKRFSFKKYKDVIIQYQAFMCLWTCRICGILIAYQYNGYPGFAVLSWVLGSFIIQLYIFANLTAFLYVPLFIFAFLLEYFYNIQQLFMDCKSQVPRDCTQDIHQGFFQNNRKVIIWPIEVSVFVIKILCLFVLVKHRGELKDKRDQFRKDVLGKITNPSSSALWQVAFYILKFVHIIVLTSIFLFSITGVNLYFIGLLYFFLRYVSSMHAYRKCGSTLVAYAGFFIWIQYLWALARPNFKESVSPFVVNLVKFLDMLTLIDVKRPDSSKNEDPNQVGNAIINDWVPLENPIPVTQWLILLLCFFLYTANRLFKKESKPIESDSYDGRNTIKKYNSKAEVAEAQLDYRFTQNYPTISKVGIRIRIFLSEIMILMILILQSLILVFQEPNLLYWGFMIFSLTLQYAVVSPTVVGLDLNKRCVKQAINLKGYAIIVLVLQISYKLINDKDFLKKYGWDQFMDKSLGVFGNYMPVIGFSKPSAGDQNIIMLFLSPIIFYISTTILKDHFANKVTKEEALLNGENDGKKKSCCRRFLDDKNDEQKLVDLIKQPLIEKIDNEEIANKLSQGAYNDTVNYIQNEFEQTRFTVSYIIYQRRSQWHFLDKIAENFHLISAAVAIFLCANWQVSGIMYVQFICAIRLCVQLATNLYDNSIKQTKKLSEGHNQNVDADDCTKEQTMDNRNNINEKEFQQEFMTITDAHQKSKKYMTEASKQMQSVRNSFWNWQYGLLIAGMIIMYPTPLMNKMKEIELFINANSTQSSNQTIPLNNEPNYLFQFSQQDINLSQQDPLFARIRDESVWWMFWLGVYVDPKDSSAFSSHFPLYIMLTLFVIEKLCQRWMKNRYGCSKEEVKKYMEMEERLQSITTIKEFENNKDEEARKELKNVLGITDIQKLIAQGALRQLVKSNEEVFKKLPMQSKDYLKAQCMMEEMITSKEEIKKQLSSIKKADDDEESQFVTYQDAENICQGIKEKYRTETEEEREARIRKEIIKEIKRKYTIQFREALRFIIEIIILQLVLFSCAQKANIFSLLYLVLLLMYLLVEDKQKGILNLAKVIGYSMIFEYLMTLMNLTKLNSPMQFPEPYQNYPCLPAKTNQTLPDCTKIYSSGYAMPIFMNTVLRDNLPYAMYLGIDVLRFQLNDIWFDIINLSLITIYFYAYGNPLYNSQDIKISFSKTSSIEKKLREYSKIQDNKLILVKEQGALEKKANHVLYIRDGHQEFLGSTFYLMKLKNKAFIYNFTRKMRIFSYIGLQLVAVIFIFIIAALSRSLMSFGYLLICMYLFWNMKDFFYQDRLQQQNQKWMNPYVIKRVLLTYSFIDIALQILYQIPYFDVMHTNDYIGKDETGQLQYLEYSRYLGFDKIYMINHTLRTLSDIILNTKPSMELAHLDRQNLYYFILKSMNLFFIFLMVQIYSSNGYKKFIRSDLRTYLVMANNFKAFIMAYFYNNRKLEKMIQIQQKKKTMILGLESLTKDVKAWKRSQDAVLLGIVNRDDEEAAPTKIVEKVEERKVRSQTSIMKTGPSAKGEKNLKFDLATVKEEEEDEKQPKKKENKLLQLKEKILGELNEKFSMEKLNLLNQKDPSYKKKEDSFKLIQGQLPILAKWYLKLNQQYVNQALFIETINEANRIRNEAKKGIRNTNCDLKSVMMKEINIFIEKQIEDEKRKKKCNKLKSQIKQERKAIKLDKNDMPETTEFVKFTRISISLLGVIPKAIISKMAVLAYLFMILSMITNAGFISALYPFMVFGYALMEEGRPKRHFWNIVAFYTIFIIFLKTIFQLDIWFLFNRLRDPAQNMNLVYDAFPFTYQDLNNSWRIGLIRVEGIIEMFIYILPEFLILICVWTQQFYEIMVGVHEAREVDLENISEARNRFLEAFNEQAQEIQKEKETAEAKKSGKKVHQNQPKAHKQQKETSEDNEWKNMKMLSDELKRVKKEVHFAKNPVPGKETLIEEGVLRRRGQEDYQAIQQNKLGQREQARQIFFDYNSKPKLSNSLIPDREQLKERVRTLKAKKLTTTDKLMKYVKKQTYFISLFPLIKEQKPGRDMYATTTFWQFVICFYMINNYSMIDARGTQILENTNQYSYNMTIMVFIQVGLMIAERYISRTNVRKHNRAKNAQQVLEKTRLRETGKNTTMLSSNGSRTKSLKSTQKLHTKLIATFKPNSEQDQLAQLEDYTKLEPTYITIQQFLKWFIQIAQLLMYHYVIFWLYPIASNNAIYGKPICDKNSNAYQKDQICYDFTQNYYLIVFYLLFCIYFRQCALQIRYGFSDWREPSSLTRRSTSLAQNLNIIYTQLPFLLELKTVLDWCFTRTSLDIFQWLELAEVNNQMFNAQVSNGSYYDKDKKLGKRVTPFEKKFCGCFCLSVMLFFLVGPFAFFSNMSFVATYNPVQDLKLGFGLTVFESNKSNQVDMKYEFQLYTTESPILIYQLDEQQFNNQNYDKQPETKFFDPQQVQYIQMKNSSDTMWQASSDYKQLFKDLMKRAANPTSNGSIRVDAVLDYQFMRELPVSAKTIKGNYSWTLSDSAAFKQMAKMDDCSTRDNQYQLPIQHFMPKRLRAGTSDKVNVLSIQKSKDMNESDFLNTNGQDDQQKHNDFSNVILTYSCNDYWAFEDSPDKGITLQLFSDLISTGFWSEASIFAFYLGTAMTIGTLFRTIVMYKSDRIFILDARDTKRIRNLIAAIYRQRHEQNLKREEELYFLLIEILRNPQLFTHLTGSSLKGRMDPQYEEEEKKKELKKQKTLKQMLDDDHEHKDQEKKE